MIWRREFILGGLAAWPLAARAQQAERMRRIGGNITDFTSFELSIAGKWLQVLKEIAPSVTRLELLREAVPGASRVAVLINTATRASSLP